MSDAINNVVALPNNTAARIQETGVLLERPVYTRPTHHDVVYALVGGRVGTAPLARYRLPRRLRQSTLIVPDSGDAYTQSMLPELAALADRIAPWVSVHIVPRILSRRQDDDDYGRHAGHYEVEGVRYSAVGGLACYEDQLILLNSGSPLGVTKALCHELMHFAWHRLSESAQAALREAVSDGADWPGNYYSNVEERVARLFENWSSARVEGMPASDADDMSVEDIFDFVWSGALANHQIQRGLVPGAAALRVRRGLPPPEPEVVEVETRVPDATDDAIAFLTELAAATSRLVVRVARWVWHGSAATV